MKPSYYAVIPADIRYDKNLNPNMKLLYGEISALSNTSGYCWANNKYFARLYDVKRETVSRWISRLKKLGYIKVKYHYNENSTSIRERRIYLNRVIKVEENNKNKELEEDKVFSNIIREYENNGFGLITLTSKDLLVSLVEDYSQEWVSEAIKEAVRYNKRSLRYVEAILRRWESEGKDKSKKDYDPYKGFEEF